MVLQKSRISFSFSSLIAAMSCSRAYTSACYKSLNNPLRGLDAAGEPRPLSREQPHPFPVTVHLLTAAMMDSAVMSPSVKSTPNVEPILA